MVELFAGCGTLTFPLAARASVTAIEGDAALVAALDDAARHARGLKAIRAIRRNLVRAPLTEAEFAGAEAIVLDPPRAGAEAQIPGIVASAAERVAYVSCNPTTFARDARALVAGGFDLTGCSRWTSSAGRRILNLRLGSRAAISSGAEIAETTVTNRQRLAAWLDSARVRNAIIAVIVFNAVLLGLETSALAMNEAGPLIVTLDRLCLSVFVIEIGLKLYAHRMAFFRSGWNLFDFVIVGIALVPAAQGLSVLRAMRILRVLRVITVAPSLRRVVEGLMTALPGMGSVFLLMGVIFYIGAVMSTKLFGAAFPDWFGTIGRSLYSLFQIMTLESWSMGIVRPVMEQFPGAWLFFVPFIMVTTFAVVNLIVGLVVNSMQDAHAEEANAATDSYRDEVLERLRRIEARMEEADSRDAAE